MSNVREKLGRMFVSSLSVGTAIALMSVAAPATAQTAAPPLSQQSGDLPSTLTGIERHFGVRIVFDRAVIANSRGQAVRQAATAVDAIEQAIADTGLSYQADGAGEFRVLRPEGGEVAIVDEIVVVAIRDEAETNLNVNSAASSTRTGKSLREQPRSTAVVTARLIEEQQVQSIQEALRNVSGTTASAGTQGLPSFTVRGYRADALTNGLAVSSGSQQPVAGLERIEVLKGPDVVLVGADNLGGVVNIVTKRPTATPLLNVALELGSFEDKRITVDGSNALNESRTVSARIVGTAAKAERTYQGYDGREEDLFAPSLRYRTADSDFIVGLSTSTTLQPKPSATIIDKNFTDRQVIRPFVRTPLGPERQGARLDVKRGYFNFTQSVTEWLTLVARGEHADTSQELKVYLPGFAAEAASSNLYAYYSEAQRLDVDSDALDTYARLNFATGPVRHTLTGGFNYSLQKQTTSYPLTGLPIYQFNLVTGAGLTFPPPGAEVTSFPPLPDSTERSFYIPIRQQGFYIQDFLEIDRLKLLAALRVNKYQNGITFFSPDLASFNSRRNYSATLPSFGAVYDVHDHVSVYANFQRGYTPSFSNNLRTSTVPGAFTGEVFPDIRTRNIEAGVKVDLFDKKVAVVASYYLNRQSNLVDTSTVPGAAFLIPGQEAKGFELDITGQILPSWSIAASFSRTEFSPEQPTPTFQVVAAQPETKYSFFTSYEPTAGPLKGFGVSAGIYGASRSFMYAGSIDPTNAVLANRGAFYDGFLDFGTPAQQAAAAGAFATFRPFVPASRQVDANIYYTIGITRLNLGVKNLFDRRNYGTTITPDFIPVSEPRTFRATLSLQFY